MTEKEFWQHAEVLVGFLDGYEVFKDPRYLKAFEAVKVDSCPMESLE